MAFCIRKKRTGIQKKKKEDVLRDKSNEQAKRKEFAEWDAIAESTKRLRGQSDLESVDDDG